MDNGKVPMKIDSKKPFQVHFPTPATLNAVEATLHKHCMKHCKKQHSLNITNVMETGKMDYSDRRGGVVGFPNPLAPGRFMSVGEPD